jgi:polyisoprenoid-binding protein YceI
MKKAFLLLSVCVAANAQAADCEYRFDPAQVVVGFTAYKTSEKTPVNGRFLKTEIDGRRSGPSLTSILKGLTAQVDVTSLETDNPGRNATIIQGFFKNLAHGMRIEGKVRSLTGTDEKGELTLRVRMNGVEKSVKLAYTYSDASGFEASGPIDVLKDFRARKSLDALHELCAELHKGKDGVSKTWSEVMITLKSPVNKSCTP